VTVRKHARHCTATLFLNAWQFEIAVKRSSPVHTDPKELIAMSCENTVLTGRAGLRQFFG